MYPLPTLNHKVAFAYIAQLGTLFLPKIIRYSLPSLDHKVPFPILDHQVPIAYLNHQVSLVYLGPVDIFCLSWVNRYHLNTLNQKGPLAYFGP